MNVHKDRIGYLLEKYKKGRCTKSELAELTQHLKSKEGKEILIEDMEQSFDVSLEANAEPISEEISARMRTRLLLATKPLNSKKSYTTINRWLIGLAASVLLIVTGWWLYGGIDDRQDIEWQSLKTVIGEQKKIGLPDGSTIFLNGDSEILFPRNLSKMDYRIIKLKGEAFFDVASDSTRPFFVLTSNFSIRVLGTSFNVDTELEESVTVHEGQVQVVPVTETQVNKNLSDLLSIWSEWIELEEETLTSSSHTDISEKPTPTFVSLGPLEKAGLEENNELRKMNVPKTNDWMHKNLGFYDQPLELVIQQLERYYGTKIRVQPELAGCKITLAANKKTLDEALNGLTGLIKGGKVVSQDGEQHIVGSSCQ